MKLNRMTEKHLDYIREFGHLLTLSQLSKELGFSPPTVLNRVRNLGITPARTGKRNKGHKYTTFQEYCQGKYQQPESKQKAKETRPPAVYSNPNWEARIDELLAMDV